MHGFCCRSLWWGNRKTEVAKPVRSNRGRVRVRSEYLSVSQDLVSCFVSEAKQKSQDVLLRYGDVRKDIRACGVQMQCGRIFTKTIFWGELVWDTSAKP